MTLIENMSEPERKTWATLIVDICVFTVFIKSMTSGSFPSGLNINTHSASEMVGLYIWIIIVTIILHAIISGIFAARAKSDGYEKDERDADIERRGARNGFWFVSIAINIIIFQLLVENSLSADYKPLFSVLSPSNLFFALMGTMFVGDIIYRATMVRAYHGHVG